MKQNWTVDSVDLNVLDLEKMTKFYTEDIGLLILEKEQDRVVLGVDSPLLRLFQIDEQRRLQTTDLYHFALLVPSPKDLGEILISLYQKNILSGAADHGYSEALYLNDPEGNGIEIYYDKDSSVWEVLDDGQTIVGYTKEIGAQALIDLATEPFLQMPQKTKMGHVHLMVHNLKETQAFYENLGFDLKYDFGAQAKFMANGFYHHHIGANVWHGQLPKRSDNQLGVRMIHFNLPVKETKIIKDPNGIKLKINPV